MDDTQFSAEERLVRDSVRDWVSKEFLPRLQEHIRQDGSFPMELVSQIADLGMFGANLQGYGCAGMNNVAYGLLMQELERLTLSRRLTVDRPGQAALDGIATEVWKSEVITFEPASGA